jgi:hypothetical protein
MGASKGHGSGCACCADGFDAVLDREDRAIADYGFNYTLVFGGDDAPGFIYTTGLAEKRLPEFIFVGSSEPRSHAYLAKFIEHEMAGGVVAEGLHRAETAPNPFRVPAWIIPADDKLDSHAFGVRARLRRIGSDAEPRLLQVVMPDLAGRFPWEPGYEWMEQMIEKPSEATR